MIFASASKQLPPSIVDEYGRMVSAVCRKTLQNGELATDAAQEVWLEAVRSYPSFDHRSKFSTWLYTIAYRVVIRYAAEEKVYSTRFLRSHFHGDELAPPEKPDLDHELWVKEMCDKCLTGVLHCLDREARITYIFRDVAQLSYSEIAAVLGKEELGVRQIISRSRRKLKNFLNDECLLYNPKGSCRCRMRGMVEKINLAAEYEKIRTSVNQVYFFRCSEQAMPGKNYWEKYL